MRNYLENHMGIENARGQSVFSREKLREKILKMILFD